MTLNNAAVNVLKAVDEMLLYRQVIYGYVETTHYTVELSNMDLLFDDTIDVKFDILHHKVVIV